MSDKKTRVPKSFRQLTADSIYYVNFESVTPRNNKKLPRPTSVSQNLPGPPLAQPDTMPPVKDDAAVNIIANAPEVVEPPDADIPDEYQFELYRLRRRVAELESIVKDRDERIVRALGMIEDELQMWRTLIHQHIQETLGAIHARVLRLESCLCYLKEKGAHFWPPLEIPARWQRDKSTP